MIDWLKNTPETPMARLLLAHGAGAPMDSEFMQAMAEGLCSRGVEVWRFEFPYMRERRHTGKKRPPDRQPVLLDCWRVALEEAIATPSVGPLVIGGKSLGGRMASLMANEPGVAALVCLGYPFHPVGKPDKTRLEPLQSTRVPTLIVQGTRDALGNHAEVSDYPLPAALNWLWLEDGDHDFKPRVKSGYQQIKHWQSAIEHTAGWIESLLGERA